MKSHFSQISHLKPFSVPSYDLIIYTTFFLIIILCNTISSPLISHIIQFLNLFLPTSSSNSFISAPVPSQLLLWQNIPNVISMSSYNFSLLPYFIIQFAIVSIHFRFAEKNLKYPNRYREIGIPIKCLLFQRNP